MQDVFHAYDIRGKYPSEIDPAFARRLGTAIGAVLSKSVGVGRDARYGSRGVEPAFIEGLLKSGARVTQISKEPTPTPLVAFFSRQNRSFAVNITASHNPPEYTGFKIMDKNGMSFNDWDRLKDAMNKDAFEEGVLNTELWNENYVDAVTKGVSSDARIAVDSIGGAGTVLGPVALKAIGATVVPIYTEFSDTFYGREPEPKENNLHLLQQRVIDEKAAFGVAFDGDADRVVFVDDAGRVVPTNEMAYWFSQKLPKGRRVFSVDCTNNLNGPDVRWSRVGNTFISKIMVKEDCVFGAERSGHYYFDPHQYHALADGILPCVLTAGWLKDQKLSEALRSVPQMFSTAGVIHYSNHAEKNKAMESIANTMKASYSSEKILTVDGVKVNEANGWFLVRTSNTEPLIRYTVEGSTKEDAEKLESDVKRFFK